jgi:hypothetical protein
LKSLQPARQLILVVRRRRREVMQTYENAYYGLRIDFPDKWNLVSWKHAKIGRSSRSAFQTRDDDLPSKGLCASKILFTACLYSPESQVLVDADIEFSVFRLAEGEDMRQTLLENHERQHASYEADGIATSITKEGTWRISGIDFGYVDDESKTPSAHSQYRFLFRRVDEVFWLYCKIAGHKEWAFNEAIKIMEAMQCNMGGSAESDAVADWPRE